MKKMSRKQFLRWEKLRMKGRSYVVFRAAILSGVVFFIMLNLVSWLWKGFALPPVFLLVYPGLGLAAGTFNWWLNEERFDAFLLDKKANAGPRRK